MCKVEIWIFRDDSACQVENRQGKEWKQYNGPDQRQGWLGQGGIEGDKTRQWIRTTFTKWNKPEK